MAHGAGDYFNLSPYSADEEEGFQENTFKVSNILHWNALIYKRGQYKIAMLSNLGKFCSTTM